VDLSKLPRLSGTDASAPAPAPVHSPTRETQPQPPAVPARTNFIAGPDLWISLIVGVLMLGLSRHFGAYLLDRATGQFYHTGFFFIVDGVQTTNEVPYSQLEGLAMLSDAAIFAFGLALIFDAIMRTVCLVAGVMVQRLAIGAALCFTIAATLFNAYAAIKLLHIDITPLISGLAIAFGGYMAFEQIRAVRAAR